MFGQGEGYGSGLLLDLGFGVWRISIRLPNISPKGRRNLYGRYLGLVVGYLVCSMFLPESSWAFLKDMVSAEATRMPLATLNRKLYLGAVGV